MCYRSLGGHYMDGVMMFIFSLLSVWPLCFGIRLGLRENQLVIISHSAPFRMQENLAVLYQDSIMDYDSLENKNKLETLISKSHSWIYEQASPRRMVSKWIF